MRNAGCWSCRSVIQVQCQIMSMHHPCTEVQCEDKTAGRVPRVTMIEWQSKLQVLCCAGRTAANPSRN